MRIPGQDITSTVAAFNAAGGEQLQFRIEGAGPHHIILLHGFAACNHTWDDLVPFFSPDRYTLHLIDLKGHGASTASRGGNYSPLHNARLVAAHISSHRLNNVTLVGHSLGGAVGLLSALDCPDIARLVLLDAPVFPQKLPRFMRILRLPLLGPLLMSVLPPEKIARKGLEAVFRRQERITGQLVERYAAGYRRKGAACALARTVRQIVPSTSAELTARYNTLSIPVLILWGEHDRIVKPWQAEQLQTELPDSQLILIPDCGHNPHEELPEVTFGLIRDFLSGTVDKLTRS